MLPPILQSNREAIRSLCERHQVIGLDAFGSVLRADFRAESDVDFLVKFYRDEDTDAFLQYFEFKEGLEAILNRRVDLVCEAAIRNSHFKRNSKQLVSLSMPHSIQKLVEDALTACSELRSFTEGKNYSDLVNDRGLQLIVERLFEVIGEALYRLRNLDEATFEEIHDGHRVIGTRNLLAHGYDIVDHDILWAVVENRLEQLETDLIKISK